MDGSLRDLHIYQDKEYHINQNCRPLKFLDPCTSKTVIHLMVVLPRVGGPLRMAYLLKSA